MNNINLFHIHIDERVTRDSSVFPVNELCTLVVLRVYSKRGGGNNSPFNVTCQIKIFPLEYFG